MHRKLVLRSVALSAAVLIGGCFGHAGASAEVDTPMVFAAEPTLVVVEPGIWVVRDYDYPVYYVDDYYWVYRDNVWHRSRTYDGGWARVEASTVPRQIVSRDHRAYIHYHGAPDAPTRSAPRERASERARPERPAERRDLPPDRSREQAPREPERADDRHDAPPERPRASPERPRRASPERPRDEGHAGDRRVAPPRRDERPGADPHAQQPGNRDNEKREDHEQADERKRDEQRKQQDDEQKRGGKRDDHDKR